jgi:Ankyrin repeats (many copies)
LHIAVVKGHVEIVLYLLEKGGAKVEAINPNQQTSLHLACTIGYLAIVKVTSGRLWCKYKGSGQGWYDTIGQSQTKLQS